jgi:L-amino acid N-acyltransferase YncA
MALVRLLSDVRSVLPAVCVIRAARRAPSGARQAETHPANVASQPVVEKAGFVRKGVIRRSCFSRGAWRDTAMYSLLREEWREPRVLPAGYR